MSSEERAGDLISRLMLEEKASLMCDQSDAVPRLGIKKFNWWSEALHGLANNSGVTVFPQPVGMAAGFDDELVYRIFNAVSDETRAKYNVAIRNGHENRRFLSLFVWTPNINIFRDPRWGRGQETYDEDPYLTSRMGVSVVKGLQGPEDARYRKLLACAKHYAVHSGPEWSRHEINLNNINPRELYETCLPAFKSLVQHADVRQVMCAYQRLDDEPCYGNTRLLQRILRDEWGYEHIVVSDCGAVSDFYTSHNVSSGAVHAASKAVLSSTDVECIWEDYTFKTLPEAVERGPVKEEDINKSLLRVLKGRFDLGEMDDDAVVPWAQIPESVINNEDHRRLALEMARESMTLLQNKNNILPLKKSVRKTISLVPETETCDVILQAWYSGESGGQAVADVLFGDYNPSGKLPVTFYRNLQQLSEFEDYSMEERTYRYMSDPLFRIGFGLSYTSFSIGTAELSKTRISTNENIQLAIPVTNSGKTNGTEVVQVYVSKVNDIEGPLKTLRGFKRVEIPAGKTRQVTTDLTPASFEFYDWNQRKMSVTPGDYEVYYGNSSDTKDLKIAKVSVF